MEEYVIMWVLIWNLMWNSLVKHGLNPRSRGQIQGSDGSVLKWAFSIMLDCCVRSSLFGGQRYSGQSHQPGHPFGTPDKCPLPKWGRHHVIPGQNGTIHTNEDHFSSAQPWWVWPLLVYTHLYHCMERLVKYKLQGTQDGATSRSQTSRSQDSN